MSGSASVEAAAELWSLFEMLNIYARYFARTCVLFTEMIDHLKLEIFVDDAPISTPSSDGSGWEGYAKREFWEQCRAACEGLDLDSAMDQVDRVVAAFASKPEMRRSKLQSLIEDLRNRILDQLKSRWMLYMPLDRVGYWEQEALFGEEVFNKIPEITIDVYEAGSCYAAGRAGGTVYHCMGIMQGATFKAGKEIGCIINLEIDDWGTAESKIKAALDQQRIIAEQKKGDATAYALWKRKEAGYNELLSDLNAVKKAWRHTHMHFRQTFNLEHAKKILDKVQEFAQYAATLIA
jgi:hypothetical protein